MHSKVGTEIAILGSEGAARKKGGNNYEVCVGEILFAVGWICTPPSPALLVYLQGGADRDDALLSVSRVRLRLLRGSTMQTFLWNDIAHSMVRYC